MTPTETIKWELTKFLQTLPSVRRYQALDNELYAAFVAHHLAESNQCEDNGLSMFFAWQDVERASDLVEDYRGLLVEELRAAGLRVRAGHPDDNNSLVILKGGFVVAGREYKDIDFEDIDFDGVASWWDTNG